MNLSDTIRKRLGDSDLSLNVLLQEIDLSPKQAPAPPTLFVAIRSIRQKGWNSIMSI